jgi:cytochrome c-type biogenesis protein CcmH/NrfG
VGIFKCFAENGIELNTLSNQAPSALLKAIKRLPDNIEIRSAYAKIIKLLASTNEMTRDTLLRFAAEVLIYVS